MLNFLHDLDNDLRKALLIQLRNLWTHTSTAIEGNTLTLGETAFVLEEGLTISGKPLKDHEEVVGHARAIDLVYDLVQNKTTFTKKELFSLHKAVQTKEIVDVYKPVGGWKKEPNSTVAVVGDKQQRKQYIDALSAYHFSVGQIKPGNTLLPNQDALQPFTIFCEQAWKESYDLVEEIRQKQRARQQ